MLSEEVVLEARAVIAQGAIEAGAETVDTGGEERDKVGQGGEAIPVKDSRLWDPSLATAAEMSTLLVPVMSEAQAR